MRVSNTAIGLVVVVFAIGVILYSQDFPKLEEGYPGPALFPIILAVLFILCGVILIVQGIRNGEGIWKFDLGGISFSGAFNIVLTIGAILFYIFFSEFLGFHITSFLLLFILMKKLNVSTKWSLIMSAGATFLIYALFAKMLLVPLPWGLWGW